MFLQAHFLVQAHVPCGSLAFIATGTCVHSSFPDVFVTVILFEGLGTPTLHQFAHKVSGILKELSSFKFLQVFISTVAFYLDFKLLGDEDHLTF